MRIVGNCLTILFSVNVLLGQVEATDSVALPAADTGSAIVPHHEDDGDDDGLTDDTALLDQLENQSASDEAHFKNIAKLEKMRSKLIVLERRDFDYRSVLRSYNITGVLDLEGQCSEQCVEDCFSQTPQGVNVTKSNWVRNAYAQCILPKCKGCQPHVKLSYLQDLLPLDMSVGTRVNPAESMRELLETNSKRVANTSASLLTCDITCAKDVCLDLFKKKTPFPVSMGCIRGACSCQALDLSKNVYQQFMGEVARRAAAGVPAGLPDVKDTDQQKTGIDVESITGGTAAEEIKKDATNAETQKNQTTNDTTPAATDASKPTEPAATQEATVAAEVDEQPAQDHQEVTPDAMEVVAVTSVANNEESLEQAIESMKSDTVIEAKVTQQEIEEAQEQLDAQLLLPSIGLTLAIAIFGTALVLTQVLDNHVGQYSDEYEAEEVERDVNAKFTMVAGKQAVYHKMEDDEEAAVTLPDEHFANFKQDPPRMNASPVSQHASNDHLVVNLADQAMKSFWQGYAQITKVMQAQTTGGKPQLKKIEGEGAESEEEFEYAEGVTVSSENNSPRGHEANKNVSNRRTTNRWSSMNSSAEAPAEMAFDQQADQKVEQIDQVQSSDDAYEKEEEMVEVRSENNDYNKYEDSDIIDLDKQEGSEEVNAPVEEQHAITPSNVSLDQIADEASQVCSESEDDLASEIMGKY